MKISEISDIIYIESERERKNKLSQAAKTADKNHLIKRVVTYHEKRRNAMTNREFYTAITNLTNIPEELIEFATESIAKLDATNEKRKAAVALKSAEKQAEKAPIREALFAVMGGEDAPMTATELVAAAGLDIKPASVPSLMRPLVEAGQVGTVDVKVKGKGTQRGYVKLG